MSLAVPLQPANQEARLWVGGEFELLQPFLSLHLHPLD